MDGEVLTFLQLVVDGGFEVKGFYQRRLLKHQCVSHTVDIDAFSGHPYTQLCKCQETKDNRCIFLILMFYKYIIFVCKKKKD